MDRDRAIVTLQSPEDRPDDVVGLWKNSTIAVRSNRDRGAIEPRSGSLHGGIGPNRGPSGRRSTNDQDHDRGPIVVRSWPNRGPIVARSRLKCMIFGGKIEADWLRNRPLDAIKPLPQARQLPTIFRPILSLNTHVLLPFFLTFDRFAKELSEF